MRCLFHPKKYARFRCLTCKGLQFCRQCAITTHANHTVHKAAKISPENFHLRDINDMHSNISKCLANLESLRQDLENTVQKEIQSINQRARDMMQFIAFRADQMTEKLQKVKQEKFKILNDWERQFFTCSQKFQSIQSIEAKDSGDGMRFIKEYFSYGEYFLLIQNNLSELQEYKSELPVFVPAANFQEDLEQMFGDFSYRESNASLNSDVASGSVLTDKGYISTGSIISDSVTFLHAQDNVIRTLSPMDSEHCWVVKETDHGAGTDIELVNKEGRLKEARSLSTEVLDIAYASGDSFVACSDKTIKRIYNNGGHITLFKTNSRPESLCKLNNKSIVVCFYKKGLIQKFDVNGRPITCLERDGDLIVTHPFRVRSNESQTKVVMLNADPYSVVVMEDDLSVKYFYNGSKTYYPGKLHRARVQNKEESGSSGVPALRFAPNDACFDCDDNVLVTDCAKRSLRVLNPRGIWLRTMELSHNLFPSALCLGPGCNLWLGFNTGFIRVQKYTSEGAQAPEHVLDAG